MKNQRGVSLVELLLVIAVLGILVFLVGSLPNSIALSGKSRKISLAREIVTKKIEDLRSIQYSNLALGEDNITDSRLGLLPGGSGQVLIEECSLSVCTQSEDARKITVTVKWKESGKDQDLSMVTLVAEGGLEK